MMLSSHTKDALVDLKACIDAGFKELAAQHEHLKKQATSGLTPIEAVENVSGYLGGSGYSFYPSDWISRVERELTPNAGYSYQTHPKPSIEQMEKEVNKRAGDAKIKADTTHEANLPKMASNKALAEKLHFLMGSIKMPATYRGNREVGRRGKTETVRLDAGYKSDIAREISVDDGYARFMDNYRSLLKELETYVQRRRSEEHAAKVKAEAEAKKMEADRLLGVYLGRYNLGVTAGWSDILDAVLAKDKHLRLAHYLALNRGDWSEGCSYAREGLRGFPIETAQDREIYEDIKGYCSDWDGDGRVFRDCSWSYDRLLSLVPPAIKAEYDEVVSKMPA